MAKYLNILSDTSSAGLPGCSDSEASRKRKFREIANECVITENEKVFCRISLDRNCKYFQLVSRYDAGNFIRHFRGVHPEEARKRGLFHTQTESTPKKSYTPKKRMVAIDRRTIIEALVLLVTDNRLPFAALEWKGLRMLLDPLCAATGIRLSQSMLQRHVSKAASHMIKEITDQMNDTPISLKVDSASRHGRHVFCINAQYAKDEEVVISTLGMIDANERLTAKFLKGKIVETLSKYNITFEQVVTITCDNGSNMLAAVRDLQSEYQKSILPDDNDLEDDSNNNSVAMTEALDEELCAASINAVRCAAHTIQLAVSDTVKLNDEVVMKITQVAKNCRKIPYRSVFYTNEIGLPPLYSRTRWGGIYVMLEHFQANENFYKTIAIENKELDLTEHWDCINEYLAAFKPVFVCSKKMQAIHVGLSDVYMMWLQVMKEIKTLKQNRFRDNLSLALGKRLHFVKDNIACKAALLMDPRFNYNGSNIFKEEEKTEIRKFISVLYGRITRIKRITNISKPTPPEKPADDMEEFLMEMFGGSPIEGGGNCEILKTHINNLDTEPHQHHTYDVWQHWMHRNQSHPQLYEIAKVLYAIPSTQVSVERAFSALGLILTERRTKLSESSLNNILLIKLNVGLLEKIIPTLLDWDNDGEFVE